ncbi:tetratricopeptide repeat protein [Bremerella sp. JC817]|uniref:tetratricopeptide repeat protein n=1 Tax=Bremerella sp. JC817 TaxID=3231756 RepID=UPI0034575800
MEQHDRIRMLVGAGRYEEARKQLMLRLVDDPEDLFAHLLLVDCLIELKDYSAAVEHAETAVGLAPEFAETHGCLAFACLMANRLADAEMSAKIGVAIDPESVSCWLALGTYYSRKSQWQQALNAADTVLALDPQHHEARNLRAFAMRGLGKLDASQEELRDTLRENPESEYSHCNFGWNCLHRGQIEEAEVHFREALRLDPNYEDAHRGALETLKAKSPIYRRLLAFLLWLGTKTTGMQWMIILGILGVMIAVDRTVEWLQLPRVAAVPIDAAVILFGAALAFSDAVTNFMLLFHPFGRLAMSRWERWQGAIGGPLILLAVGTMITSRIVEMKEMSLINSGVLTLALPTLLLFQAETKWARWAMVGALVLAVPLTIGRMILAFGPEDLPLLVLLFCLPSIFIYRWWILITYITCVALDSLGEEG